MIDAASDVVRALDILFKSHYVFNVKFAQPLIPFYNFMETFIYKINLQNVRASVDALHTTLIHLKDIQC